MSRPSLRWVFLVPILTAIVFGFTAFAFYADRVERSNRIADIDAELRRAELGGLPRVGGELPAGASSEDEPPPGGPPPDDPINEQVQDLSTIGNNPIQLLADRDGNIVTSGAAGNPFSAETLEMLLAVDGFVTVEDSNFRVLVFPRDGQPTSITALSLDSTDAAKTEFRRAVALGGGIIVGLVAAVVWLLVRSLTRPITRITAAATRIADGELDTPLDAPSRSRELAVLSDDLDRMLGRLTTTLEESENSAAEATRARDDMERFLADMAHELRTPLTALKGYSDLYSANMLSTTADVDRAMSRIGSESERLYRLAEDMLQLARSGIADIPTETIDIVDIAESVVADLSAAHAGRTIEVIASAERPLVVASPARVHQAILNLGANACQHSDSDVEVVVEPDPAQRTVAVRVVDHGAGINEEDESRIFLPFYRTDASRSRHGTSGAGLGLALVNQIAHQYQGTLTLERTPGGGSTFVFALPVTA